MKQDLGLQCSAWKNLSLVLGGNLPGFESFWVHDKKYFMLRRSNEVYRTGNVGLSVGKKSNKIPVTLSFLVIEVDELEEVTRFTAAGK